FHAAKRLEIIDADRARDAYLVAISCACFAGSFADGFDVEKIARAAIAVPRAESPSVALDPLLDGFAALAIDGPGAAAPLFKRAIEMFQGPDPTTKSNLRWLAAACGAAGLVWDDEKWLTLLWESVGAIRRAGALTTLATSLNSLAYALLLEGDL